MQPDLIPGHNKSQTPAVKPLGRGVSHQIAFFVSLVAGINLFMQASTSREQIGVFVFAFGVSTLLGVSALYHRVQWSQVARERMRRLDHSSIFILISGTYTPVVLLALQNEPRATTILAIVWIASLIGIFLEFAVPRAPKWLKAGLYVCLGWVIVFMAPQIIAALGVKIFGMILLGGLTYTAGAIVYALKRPNPWPLYFGYHEIFHLLVIGGAAIHYAVVTILVLS